MYLHHIDRPETQVSRPPAGLGLDGRSLRPEDLTIGTLTRELNLSNRPPWILRKMMSALEAKRIEKRLGWSRPWNKQGMTIFRSHAVRWREDAALRGRAQAAWAEAAGRVPAPYAAFASGLLEDPGLMAFAFYHNRSGEDGEYEGFTLSLGRRCREDRSKRDRLDFVLEDLRIGGVVDGAADGARIYVNPWEMYRSGEFHVERIAPGSGAGVQSARLYRTGVECYRQWKDEPSRQWEHWSARYIDYFGPRGFIPPGTSFD